MNKLYYTLLALWVICAWSAIGVIAIDKGWF
ncbi:hypothetical protein VP199E371_P0062 [Vibrio phage 199E37-1]|nr:hypothetical protein VP199E371_P0062 [Vibrio phage 199E37-1]